MTYATLCGLCRIRSTRNIYNLYLYRQIYLILKLYIYILRIINLQLNRPILCLYIYLAIYRYIKGYIDRSSREIEYILKGYKGRRGSRRVL